MYQQETSVLPVVSDFYKSDLNKFIEDPELSQKVFDLLDVSELTLKDYRYRIHVFTDYVKQEGFNHNTFRNFKRHLDKRIDIKTGTKNRYLFAAKIWLRELTRIGVIKYDITINTKGFKQDKKHKKFGLAENEVISLLIELKNLPDEPGNYRLRAMFSLLIYQGLRQIEISRLDYTDLNLINGTAMIRGKGRDEKEVIYLHPETVKALEKYLKTNKINSGALFVCISNKAKNQRLRTCGIRAIVKSTLIKFNIENSTHGFRHYFTTNLIQKYKGDITTVQKYTRHRSLEMLQVYNDNINQVNDLPRYYEAFNHLNGGL